MPTATAEKTSSPDKVRKEQDRIDKILELLFELLLLGGSVRSLLLYRQIQKETSELERLMMLALISTLPDLSPAELFAVVSETESQIRTNVTLSINRTAQSLSKGLIPADLASAVGLKSRDAKKLTDAQKVQLQKIINKGLINRIGQGGKMRRYGLDYYLSLVLHGADGKARKVAALEEAAKQGWDLVQISPQPSTIGDYCDLYRGRVFSISGSDPTFPPLSDCPSGGAPFHPWCHHDLIPIASDSATAKQTAAQPPLPSDFVALAKAGSGPNEFQKQWIQYKSQRKQR